MPVKSRTSTQHAYMKLLVVVAILIWTNVVVANSTSDPMEQHRRLSVAAVRFKDEWDNAFKEHVLRYFDYGKKHDLLSADQLAKVREKMKDFKAFPTSVEALPQVTPGKSKINLLELPLFYTDKKGLAKEALEVLKVVEDNRISDVVNIINAGLMHRNKMHQAFAEQVEEELLNQLNSNGKSLGALFGDLQLNTMEEEMHLYLNPAFTTWMKYAIHKDKEPTEAFRSMLAVLQNEAKWLKSIDSLRKTSTGSSREKRLFEKWQYVYDHRSVWSQYHPTKKLHLPKAYA